MASIRAILGHGPFDLENEARHRRVPVAPAAHGPDRRRTRRVRDVTTDGSSDDARGRADPDAAPRPVRRRLLTWHSLDLIFFGVALVHVTLLALTLARQG